VSARAALLPAGEAVLLRVAARPGASATKVQGLQGDALKVAIAAPPEKGKANDELVRWLAKALGLRRAQVTLARGEASRDKVLRLEGLALDELAARLDALSA
jgi:uncharacterized protein (TIGR00251 family)